MSDSIGNILGKQRYDEPAELEVIRDFVRAQLGIVPGLKLTQNSIIIQVSNSGFAGALRPHLHILQNKIRSEKRLIIRIG